MHAGRPDAEESLPHPAAQDALDHLVLDPPVELCNDRRSYDSPSDEEGDLDAPGYGFGV